MDRKKQYVYVKMISVALMVIICCAWYAWETDLYSRGGCYVSPEPPCEIDGVVYDHNYLVLDVRNQNKWQLLIVNLETGKGGVLQEGNAGVSFSGPQIPKERLFPGYFSVVVPYVHEVGLDEQPKKRRFRKALNVVLAKKIKAIVNEINGEENVDESGK